MGGLFIAERAPDPSLLGRNPCKCRIRPTNPNRAYESVGGYVSDPLHHDGHDRDSEVLSAFVHLRNLCPMYASLRQWCGRGLGESARASFRRPSSHPELLWLAEVHSRSLEARSWYHHSIHMVRVVLHVD